MGDGENVTPIHAVESTLLRSPGAFTLPTIDDLHALLPDAHMEPVGARQEVVIYTGWSVTEDGVLVPMPKDKD